MTTPALHQMKREGRTSVGVVAWDYQIARIADRAGVDIVSVGDSVGMTTASIDVTPSIALSRDHLSGILGWRRLSLQNAQHFFDHFPIRALWRGARRCRWKTRTDPLPANRK